MNTAPAPGAERLCYAACLPLAWTPLAQQPSADEVQAFGAGNLPVLASVAAMEEHGGGGDEDAPLDREIARLHRKVDVLLEVVSGLLRAQSPQPPGVPVLLSAQDLLWLGSGAPAAPGWGVIDLYLHRGVPQPLRLPAQVLGQEAQGTRIAFLPLDEACAAALETHVFLRHRRSVAEARLSQKR